MQPEDFLLSIKDDLEYARDTANGVIDTHQKSTLLGRLKLLVRGRECKTSESEKLATIQKTLDNLIKRVDTHRQSPEMAPFCGLYLFDGGRQYGFTFEQLQKMLSDYNDPKSVFYRQNWGFTALVKWLHEVSHTSIGDLHGDLLKHVVVTYHRPSDFPEGMMEAKDKEYDAFWEEVKKLGK